MSGMAKRTDPGLHIRLSPETSQWLDEETERRGISRARLVERALQQLRQRESVEALG